MRAQGPSSRALDAARTASSASAGDAFATSVIFSSVVGSKVGMVPRPAASRQRPSISSCPFGIVFLRGRSAEVWATDMRKNSSARCSHSDAQCGNDKRRAVSANRDFSLDLLRRLCQSYYDVMPVTRKAVSDNRRPISDRRLHVVILTTPDAQPVDVAGPYEGFALAAKKLREMGDESGHGYDVEILTMGRGRRVTGALGLSLVAKGSYRMVKGDIDTLLVVGGMEPWNPAGKESVIAWIQKQAARVRRIAGVCTGAFVL